MLMSLDSRSVRPSAAVSGASSTIRIVCGPSTDRRRHLAIAVGPNVGRAIRPLEVATVEREAPAETREKKKTININDCGVENESSISVDVFREPDRSRIVGEALRRPWARIKSRCIFYYGPKADR